MKKDSLTRFLSTRTKEIDVEKLLNAGSKTIQELEPNSIEAKALLHHIGPTVYVLKCGKYYKIGITNTSIISRINALQVGNPFKIELAFALKVSNIINIESTLHEKFRHKNIRGEWFELSYEDFLELEQFVIDLWK